MFVAEKVLLLLVISLTAQWVNNDDHEDIRKSNDKNIRMVSPHKYHGNSTLAVGSVGVCIIEQALS